MNAIALDPALKRLLDTLPAGSPDEKGDPFPRVEVWIDFCPDRWDVPAGVHVSLDFGEWRGPPTRIQEVRITLRNPITGVEREVPVTDWPGTYPPAVLPGCRIGCDNEKFEAP